MTDLEYFQNNTFISEFPNEKFKVDAYVNFLIKASGKMNEVKLSIIDPDSDFNSLKFEPNKQTPSST